MNNADLVAVLEDAQARGFLGPGPVRRQLEHAEDLGSALTSVVGPFTGTFLDLGSGGGLPGLMLAGMWPLASGTLLDAQQKRCAFLERAVATLGLAPRMTVVCARAESAARLPEHRARFELVVARSFGPPAVTAECAVGFLRSGGRLVVSEPPENDGGDSTATRWPERGLGQLGFGSPVRFSQGHTTAVMLALDVEVADRWPRRDGIPNKRPLW